MPTRRSPSSTRGSRPKATRPRWTTRAACRSRASSYPVERHVTVTVEAKGSERRGSPLELEGLRRPRLPARARSPRRGADARPDDGRGAPLRHGRAAARQPVLGARALTWRASAFAATAPFGADVLERLAARARDRVLPDAARSAGRPGPKADRRPRRRPPRGSGFPCSSPSGSTATSSYRPT